MEKTRLLRVRPSSPIGLYVFTLAFGSLLAFAWPAVAATDAARVGIGQGAVVTSGRDTPCPNAELHVNADGTFEDGRAWQYGGIVAPFYGAFAEGYTSPDTDHQLCGIQLTLTQTGLFSGQTLDAYLWDDAGGYPGNVLAVKTGVVITPPAFWPTLSEHDIEFAGQPLPTSFFVGYWSNWPGDPAGFFVGADLDGFGGSPMTNIAPGIGFPTGWQNPSIVWGPAQALGIAAYVEDCPPGCHDNDIRACCLPDGSCVPTTVFHCETLGGQWHSHDRSCPPDPPCDQPVPIDRVTWGRVKATY